MASGPIMKDVETKTKNNPGNILKVREKTKCTIDFLVSMLLVTKSPLMKKKTFTANPPVVT